MWALWALWALPTLEHLRLNKLVICPKDGNVEALWDFLRNQSDMETLVLLNCTLNQQIFEILGNMKKLKAFGAKSDHEDEFTLFIGPQGDALVLHVNSNLFEINQINPRKNFDSEIIKKY